MTAIRPSTEEGLARRPRTVNVRTPRTLRFQLLLSVNAALAVGMAVFLATDYRYELKSHLLEERMGLEGEAKTLSAAIVHLKSHDLDAVQRHIDAVCGRMREEFSPGHHIAVRLSGLIIQAQAHDRASPAFFAAIEAAAASQDRSAHLKGRPIVVGSDRQDDVVVYVAEYVSDILARARGSLARRSIGLAFIGLLGAGIINVILIRLVTRPLDALVQTVRRIGAGHVGAHTGEFKTAELAFLGGEIDTMSTSLAQTEQERRQQLSKAKQIQENLFPKHLDVPGLKLTHLYQPATEVAGDYYDLLEMSDGSWLLCVADVSGHGVPAAMEAMVLKTLLLAAIEAVVVPGEVLSAINKRFEMVTPCGDFASMILVQWDPRSNKIHYASAGHETGYLLHHASVPVELTSTGLVLGVEPEAAWETRTCRVSPGDRLLLLTDGVTEAEAPDGQCFGRKLAAQFFVERRTAPLTSVAQELHATLMRHCGGMPPRDDITVVAVEFATLDPRRDSRAAETEADEDHGGPRGLAAADVGL